MTKRDSTISRRKARLDQSDLTVHFLVIFVCFLSGVFSTLKLCVCVVLQVMAVARVYLAPAVGLCPLLVTRGHIPTTRFASGRSACPAATGSTFASPSWTSKTATARSTTSASTTALDLRGVRLVRVTGLIQGRRNHNSSNSSYLTVCLNKSDFKHTV